MLPNHMQMGSYQPYRYNHIWTTNHGALKLPEYYYIMLNKDKQQRKVKKNKRPRTMFTTEQTNILEKYFAKHCYIQTKDRYELSKRIGIGEKQIKVWFQNRRMKLKRELSDDSYSDMSIRSPPTTSSEKSGTHFHDSHPSGYINSGPLESNSDEIINELLLFNQRSDLSYETVMFENGYVPQNWYYNCQNTNFANETNNYPTEYFPNNSYIDQNQSYNLNESINNNIYDGYEFPLSYQEHCTNDL